MAKNPKLKNSRQIDFISNSKINKEISCQHLAKFSKFSFAFLQTQDNKNWKSQQLSEIFVKLANFSQFELLHWCAENIYTIYGEEYPPKSKLPKPNSIPDGVKWGRFILGSKPRLCGFVIPENQNGQSYLINGKTYFLDTNTFYVVFLDFEHEFWPVEKKNT